MKPGTWRRVRRFIGLLGVAAALPFLAWAVLGLFEPVPSMVEVFGMEGLRLPASVTVGGLLVAAIGFYDA